MPCACGPKSTSPTPQLSILVVAIDDLVFRVSGESSLDDVYERFPLMNEIGLTFEILCSDKKVHWCID